MDSDYNDGPFLQYNIASQGNLYTTLTERGVNNVVRSFFVKLMEVTNSHLSLSKLRMIEGKILFERFEAAINSESAS